MDTREHEEAAAIAKREGRSVANLARQMYLKGVAQYLRENNAAQAH